MARDELSDDQWGAIAPLLTPRTVRRPHDATTARRRSTASSGSSAPARAIVPGRYRTVYDRTVYDRFAKHRGDGTPDRVLRALRPKLGAEGHIDHSTWMTGGTTARASRVRLERARNGAPDGTHHDEALGRSRGGARTKLHVVCDGLPLAVHGGAAERVGRVRGGLRPSYSGGDPGARARRRQDASPVLDRVQDARRNAVADRTAEGAPAPDDAV